ncbi:carbohydrate ABC transporter permease [Kitasatospora sp. NPDC058184]|uniref:carbohydrate ABC transporter permease n=1 Tax=Kitasatospora sp. NPDC058184 TaxID=3346370 RepID=UPI0036DBFE43
MRPEDVPLLFQELAREFADVTGMSVAATGSLARGDHRTGPDGDVVSNLDLIHLVAEDAYVPDIRAVVGRRMRRISDTFGIETTSVIARLPAFRLAGHAHYRISMRPEWFCDGLGLGPEAFDLPGHEDDPRAALAWMMQPVWARMAVVVVLTWHYTGYNAVIYLAGLQSIPRELYEAAMVDGAGPIRRFTSITVPALRPVLLFTVVLSTIGTLQLFDEPYVLTGGGPDNATLTVSMYLYQNGFRYFDFGYASAIAYALTLLVSVLGAVQMRLMGEKDK